MSPEQLRQAFRELHGDRDVHIYFGTAEHLVCMASPCVVKNAMLIPDEADHLVKLTDGKHVFIIVAEKVAWIRIG